jgi:hypothetical protein
MTLPNALMTRVLLSYVSQLEASWTSPSITKGKCGWNTSALNPRVWSNCVGWSVLKKSEDTYIDAFTNGNRRGQSDNQV